MKDREFYAAVKHLVGPTLEQHGFSSEGTARATYYRKVTEDLYVFVLFDLFRDRNFFDIKVFPSSPRLGEVYWSRFPDGVGILSGRAAGLNAKSGVGFGASRFPCKDAPSLEAAIANAVLPSLERFAVPYLSSFHSLADVIPILEHPQWGSLLG